MNNENEDINKHNQADDTKFICSICLNAKPKYGEFIKTECKKRKSKSCPICQKGFPYRWKGLTEKVIPDQCEVKEIKNENPSRSKTVQTSQTDVNQGLNLLNEVLTVFQSKKQFYVEKEKFNKTVIVKDACVDTESLFIRKEIKPKLTISKVYHWSILDSTVHEDNKFMVVNCTPEQRGKNSLYSIDLIKHKSSSIPQMKLEELKHSYKEKTKSKDTIEEVNRMFATVRKNALIANHDDGNRPMTRHGPRVLPVVKVKKQANDSRIRFFNDYNRGKKVVDKHCKCCQTNNYLLSSGDSIIKPDSCQRKSSDKICNKCTYMAHYHSKCREFYDVCDCCRRRCKGSRCHHHGCCEEIHDGESSASF